MSAYKVIECEVTDEEYIIAGLVGIGIPRDQIEVHEQAVPLHNYSGRKTGQMGNIVVRRENFKKLTESYYNADLGFEKVDGGYRTHINSEEQRWWKTREPEFKQIAATEHVTKQARLRGYHITKKKVGDTVKLTLRKNF